MPTRAITALGGPMAVGKTELVLTLAVSTVAIMGRKAAIVETEPGAIQPHRIREIAEKRGLKINLKDIFIVPAERVTSPFQQLLAYEAIWKKCQNENIDLGLLAVDSFSSRFRSYFTGRETLSARAAEMARHIGLLETIAAERNAAIVLTSQVMGVPDIQAQIETKMRMGGHERRIYGGEFYLHSATYILYLDRVASDVWEATLVDAPDLPQRKARFRITEKGITDA